MVGVSEAQGGLRLDGAGPHLQVPVPVLRSKGGSVWHFKVKGVTGDLPACAGHCLPDTRDMFFHRRTQDTSSMCVPTHHRLRIGVPGAGGGWACTS